MGSNPDKPGVFWGCFKIKPILGYFLKLAGIVAVITKNQRAGKCEEWVG